jgi:cell division protein FtsW
MKKLTLSLATKIFLTTLGLLLFGLIMIYSASVAEGLRDFGTKWYFVQLQLKWATVGLVGMLIISRIPTRTIEQFAPLLLGVGVLLLILVAIPGIGTKVQGARRWLILPGFTLQPAELIKFISIIYLSSWLKKTGITIWHFLAYIALIGGLIMLEPDMGTTLVVTLLAVSMYFLAGFPLKELGIIIGAGVTSALILILSAPYRMARVMTFFDPSSDPLGSSYHIRQVILALGSGGITGLGIGRSRQKYEYLPEATTDSIFAVVGEELGFIGAIILIAAFIYLIYLIFKVASRARNPFSTSLAAGVGVWLSLQVLLNLAAMVALTPLTGVPLPLVSYGGSALVTILAGIGLVLSVAREEHL